MNHPVEGNVKGFLLVPFRVSGPVPPAAVSPRRFTHQRSRAPPPVAATLMTTEVAFLTLTLTTAQQPLDLPLDWKAYCRSNSPATLQIRGNMIGITPEAQRKLSDIVESQATAVGVRVSAVRGPHGCIHGWELGLDDRERSDDVVVVQGDLQILVDSGLADDLRDAMIDYSEVGSVIGFSVEAPKAAPAGAHSGCDH